MPRSHFEQFVSELRAHLEGRLPGNEAHMQMAPRYRAEPEMLQVTDKSCREAAVLLLLFPTEDSPTLVLTIRCDDLAHHAGQISLPGGGREHDEPLSHTALREAHEEVGIDPGEVSLLGRLTPLYIPPSGFCVYPFVGAVTQRPILSPDPTEVAELLTVPVHSLCHPGCRKHTTRTVRGEQLSIPYFEINDHEIWGATAMILSEFVALLDTTSLLPSDGPAR